MIFVETIFWCAVGAIAYAYVGYPALVWALGRLFERPVRRADVTPRVSVIIAAYNEERDIAAKLENTLALDYPADRLEVIVTSDASTDRTDAIVREFAGRGVVLHRQARRLGKTAAQNAAVRVSTGDVLIFSDATTTYEPDVARRIVRPFADPEVGCVAGELVYVDRAATATGRGCASYWGYEKTLKRWESRVNGLIGVSGCLYAVRRSAYHDLARDMSSDFVIASEVRRHGLRTVYEPEAVAFEDTNNRPSNEFRMRVRVIEQTYSALARYADLLDPRRHGLYAFQMISHKVLRYAVAPLLLVAFAASAALAAESPFYGAIFALQALFYATALAGWAGERLGVRLGPLGLPFYFALANAAALAAIVKFVRGEEHVVWEPIREPEPIAAEAVAEGVAQ